MLKSADVLALSLTFLAFLGLAAAPSFASVDHSLWGELLAAHQDDGGLDYRGLNAEIATLDRYLDVLAQAELGSVSEQDRTAFWINAYNAVAAKFVLDRYPGIDSVKDVSGFFKEQRRTVAGRNLTLDEIEDEALELGGAAVHFAVNCASESCPELRGEPYVGARLQSQLDDQVERYLTNTKHGVRYESSSNELWLSSIFMWYAGDFTGGSTVVAFFARGGVLDWVVENAPSALASAIESGDPKVRYLEYDWALNDRPSAR